MTVSLNKDDAEENSDSKSSKKAVVEVALPENQKVNLCVALIELGCWLEADDLIQLIPPYSVPHNPKVGLNTYFVLIKLYI